MRLYPSILLVIVIEAVFDLQNNEGFVAFNESEFGKNMIQDILSTEIAGFYADLSNTIDDFRHFDEYLTFDPISSSRLAAVFRYEPETPVYHLRQNRSIALPHGGVAFILEKSHGDCRDIRGGNALTTSGNRILFYSRSDGGSIWIPEGCGLYVQQIIRSITFDKFSPLRARQIRFSNRNGQRPQIRGLEPRNVYHLRQHNYVEKMSQENVPRLSIQSYSDGVAIFGSESSLVIPQDYVFQLHQQTDRMTFDVDMIRLVLQPLNCSDLSFLDPLVTEEVNRIEIQVQRHQAEGNVSIHTPMGCELNVTHIYRHIGLASHPKTRRIIQYGLSREGVGGSISLTSDDLSEIRFYSTLNIYVEGVENLPPRLYLSSYLPIFGRAVFQTYALHFFIVPAKTVFHLYTVKNPTEEFYRRDTLWMSLLRMPDCKLFPAFGHIPGLSMGHIPGFSIRRTRDLFEITIKKHVLNRELAVGTQIGFRSNCDLKFREISRTIYGSFAPSERTRYSYVTATSNDIFQYT